MTLQHFQHFIGGEFCDAAETFESIDLSTERPWAVVPAASADEANQAVQAAHRALWAQEWADLTATARGRLLVRLGDLVAEHAGRLAELETRDTGKTIRETRSQIGYVAEYYRYFGGLADKLQGAHLPVDKVDKVDKTDKVDTLQREPIGVVAAIVPWNSQLFLSAVKLGPALTAGCTVVLKASEDCPAPLLEFARLIETAGFPKGTVSILTGFGEPCGRVLTSHPLVARVAFTGGPATVKTIVRNTAANLAHTTLELGGKSPVLVFADADPDNVANAVIAGIFAASGQSCVAGSRLYVERPADEPLLNILKAKAERIIIGDPLDVQTEMGPLATRRQRDGIETVLARSIDAGATVITGGRRRISTAITLNQRSSQRRTIRCHA